MTTKWNVGKQLADQTSASTHTSKVSPTSNITGKERDTLIPAKDKSPDDLEILD